MQAVRSAGTARMWRACAVHAGFRRRLTFALR